MLHTLHRIVGSKPSIHVHFVLPHQLYISTYVTTMKEGPKVIDIQTPNVSPSTQSVGSANSSGGANDLFANSPVVPISNQ